MKRRARLFSWDEDEQRHDYFATVQIEELDDALEHLLEDAHNPGVFLHCPIVYVDDQFYMLEQAGRPSVRQERVEDVTRFPFMDVTGWCALLGHDPLVQGLYKKAVEAERAAVQPGDVRSAYARWN